MKSGNFEDGIRERLIIAGIKEIEKHGLNDLGGAVSGIYSGIV